MEWGTYSMTPSLTELSLLVPLPEPAGGPPRWKHLHKPGRARPRLYWYPFSIVCRTQWEIFGRSFHAVKILLEVPASRDSLVSGFICSCAVRMTFWNGKPRGTVWTDRSETLLGGGGHPKGHYVSGGPWDMRSPETATPWGTRGGRVGRPDPWGHRRETGTVKGGVNRSTSKGKSSLAWALGHQDHFPTAFLELITVLRSVLPFEGCSWVCLPCTQSLCGGAR